MYVKQAAGSADPFASVADYSPDVLLGNYTSIPAVTLKRDVTTWLGYVLIGYYAYVQASLGPLMPFLRSEMAFSYTQGGLHFAAFALGVVINGSTADRSIRYLGRKRAIWTGGLGIALSATLLTLSPSIAATLASTLLMGYSGSLVGTSIQTMLADVYGAFRTVVVTESMIVASVCASLAPLSVGFWQENGIGWRMALWIGVGLFLVLGLRFGQTPVPEIRRPRALHGLTERRIPVQFWLYWLVIVLSVSAEWCIVFWGAAFLEEAGGLGRTVAATSMSVFLGAMLVGRFLGSRLARIYRSEQLLTGAVLLAAGGFPLFWVGVYTPLRLLGLIMMGLGVANQYPLTASTAIGTMTDRSEVASARLALGCGLAQLFAPLLLGWLADRLTVWQAFGTVAILMVLTLVMLIIANRSTRHAASHPDKELPMAVTGQAA